MAITNKLRFATLAASVAVASGLLFLVPALPAAAQALQGQSAQPVGAVEGQAVDAVAAIVNDDVITQRELQTRVDLVKRRLQQQNA
ncbi:MAG: peptidyl-prolyl cis-trans isomerase SurA, partial [Paraburkholderia sp.]|nr:peptidyl-prolyl cis-trans isomerase SurA [Paraburkholderia sp.]